MKRDKKTQKQLFEKIVTALQTTIRELGAKLTNKNKELDEAESTLEKRVNVRTAAERVIHRQLHSEIKHREHLERVLEDTLDYATGIINALRDPFVVLNEDLKVVSASPSFYQTFKVKREETEERHIYELGNGQWDIPQLRELLEDILPQITSFDDFEVEHDFPEIGTRTMIVNARKIYRRADQIELILLAIQDITEKKKAEEKLKDLASHDELTGCVNFRSIMELLEKEIERCKRYQNKFSVIMMDIDHFKSINDEHGHLAGNDALAAFADVLRKSVRSLDSVGRYGGDEFIIILPGSGPEDAEVLLERINNNLNQTKIVSQYVDDAHELTVRFSAGVAVFSSETKDLNELISNADHALHQAKQK